MKKLLISLCLVVCFTGCPPAKKDKTNDINTRVMVISDYVKVETVIIDEHSYHVFHSMYGLNALHSEDCNCKK